MTTKPKLAKKQEKVLKLLEDGKTPVQIAKAMGISPNGVYGHMRRIEAKGYEVPRSTGGGPKKARRGRPPKASTNGSGPVGEIDAGIAKLIEQAKDRQAKIDAELAEIVSEQRTLDDRALALGKEKSDLATRETALASAAK